MIWPPKELFLTVVAIKPASANSEIAKMTNAIRTSIKLKPFDFVKNFIITSPYLVDGDWILQKLYQEDFGFVYKVGGEGKMERYNGIERL